MGELPTLAKTASPAAGWTGAGAEGTAAAGGPLVAGASARAPDAAMANVSTDTRPVSQIPVLVLVFNGMVMALIDGLHYPGYRRVTQP